MQDNKPCAENLWQDFDMQEVIDIDEKPQSELS